MADALSDDNNSTRGVTTPELLRRLVQNAFAEWAHSMIPARVVRFDASTQQADVLPLIKDFWRDETGALVVGSVPVVTCVPVQFLTAGGFTFTVPIQAGDSGTTGSLIFSERSLDAWLAGTGQEVDPGFYTRFNLTDAVFMPGLLPFGAPMSVAPPTDHATAGSVAGKRIHMHDSTIIIGEGSGDGIATKTDLGVLFNAINSAPTSPSDGGATFKAAIIAFLQVAGWSSIAPDFKWTSGVALAER